MRIASEDLSAFYGSRLGARAAGLLRQKLIDAWGECRGQRLAGFGFTGEFLDAFPAAERRITMAPAAAGALGRPYEALVDEDSWPLREASVDKLLIIHGLEEAKDPRRLLREAWRVLTDDGRMIIIAANRHGFWTLFENSPFAAGRSYSRSQLLTLLGQGLFAPTAQASALYFPPFARLTRIASLWERTAERLEPLAVPLPNIAGTILIEARRSLAAPASGSKAEVLRPLFAGARPASVAAEREASRQSSEDRASPQA